MSTLNGVTFNRTGNPQADLVNYANARGISQDEAKAELQCAFGNPQQSNFSFNSSEDEETEFSLSGNPEADAKNYADINNISISAAISKLKEIYGTPTAEQSESDETTTNTEETSEDNTNTTSSSTSEWSTNKQHAYDKWKKAEDNFNYGLANGFHNVVWLKQCVDAAYNRYINTQ